MKKWNDGGKTAEAVAWRWNILLRYCSVDDLRGNQLMKNLKVYIHDASAHSLHTSHWTHPLCQHQNHKRLHLLRHCGKTIKAHIHIMVFWFGFIGWLAIMPFSLQTVCLPLWMHYNYLTFSTAMWLMDFLYTLPMEWRAIWSKNLMGTSILFLLNRYLFFGYMISVFIENFDLSGVLRYFCNQFPSHSIQ